MKSLLVLIFQIFFTFGIGILAQDVPTLNINSILQILQTVEKLDTKMEAFDTNLERMREEVQQLKQRIELIDVNLKVIDDKMTSHDDMMISSIDSKMTSHGNMMISSIESKMTFYVEDTISPLNGRMSLVEDKIILIHDLLLRHTSTQEEQVSIIQHKISEDQLCGSSNLDILYETFEEIFKGERDIQREIVRNTCSKSQVDNLQHLLATDECLDGLHNCSLTSTCQDTLIGFRCTCHSGYSGDGVNCQDIDECALGTHGCSSLAFCSNSDGGFECSCFPGYTGDGLYCKDIDECADQDDACDAHSNCINNGGSFNCLCHSGYASDGVSSCTVICEEPSQIIKELGCVIPVKERFTWDDAERNCKDSFGGKLLLMITTQEQLNELKKHFEEFCRQGGNTAPWIGVRTKWSQSGGGVEGEYPIDPNSPLWHKGQPTRGTEECVIAHLGETTPGLYDDPCTNSHTSLCQKE